MRKITTIAGALAGALALCACQTGQPTPQDDLGWVRIDKQKVLNNPALMRQFEVDQKICRGEVSKAAASMGVIYVQGIYGALQAASIRSQNDKVLADVEEGCMAERGYVLVPKSALPKA